MYKNNLVAAVKVGGKILRENGDRVELPFGCEYSILLKNLGPVRMSVKIQIDGKDVDDGAGFAILPNFNFEIERFIRKGNFDRGNRFKFIKRTEQIERTRGVEVEDGLIRVEFKREKCVPVELLSIPVNTHVFYSHLYAPYYGYPYPWCLYGNPLWYSCENPNTGGCASVNGNQNSKWPILGRSNSSGSATVHTSGFVQTGNYQTNQTSFRVDAGITVPGSESQQKFSTVSSFQTEDYSEVIVLCLVGTHEGKPIARPVTVESKPVCQTCKKVNKATSKFCSRCGTALEII